MELKEFIDNFADQFEDTERSEFTPTTEFRDLDEWSSLMGLSIMAMVSDVYDIAISANDVRKSKTIEDLFNIVKAYANPNE